MKLRVKLIFIIIVGFVIGSCKKEIEVKPKLSLIGDWNASISLVEVDQMGKFKTITWSGDITFLQDNTGIIKHPIGNPYFKDLEWQEHVEWTPLDETSFIINSKNISILSYDMTYEVKSYGKNYVYLEGFDPLYQLRTIELKR